MTLLCNYNFISHLVQISHSSVVDDSIEEHKLLNQHSEKARLRELAGEEDESEDATGESEDLQDLEQLRETVKTERGQKVRLYLLEV